jgi:ABC-type branched-subunit amino acid transport system ATPase component
MIIAQQHSCREWSAKEVDSTMLHVSGVSKSFGGIAALTQVRLDVPRTNITGIIGPNGSGKTTLLNIIGGLLRPNAGHVMLDDGDITELPVHDRARRGLTRTFQISRELGALTVLENLLVARLRQTGESIWNAFARFGSVRREEENAIKQAAGILQRVGLWKLADDPARFLSGGQKKLLELCRALMLDPKIILLDEPAAGVSPPMRTEIAQVIRSLRAEGVTFVIVEHDMEMIAGLCDQVYVFAAGTNLTSGSFHEVVSDRRVVEAYLGGVV